MTSAATITTTTTTFANPIDLDYRFQLSHPSRREAADPTLITYNRSYYLFASKSGGYWRSTNMIDWNLIEPTGLPLEDYAPTVVVWRNKLYFTAYNSRAVFTTDDPIKGEWRKLASLNAYGDPCLFLVDNDMYMASGCSESAPTKVVRLNPNNATHWAEVGAAVDGARGDYKTNGWEERGDENSGDPLEPGQLAASVEGSWVTFHNGWYYLQYAAPGTQYDSYGDGYFTSKHPLGPYTRSNNSPFSYKPTGFSPAAGHGSTFEDLNGKWWHVATSKISVRQKFERRISILPVTFEDGDGIDSPPLMMADAALGDYPTKLDGTRPWQLLTCFSTATASSSLDSAHAPSLATDEDIRTWWSAKSGEAGEWLEVELTKRSTVHALQLNFADEGSNQTGRPKKRGEAFQYIVEGQVDLPRGPQQWTLVLNRTQSAANSYSRPHAYAELSKPMALSRLRFTATGIAPAGAKWSISGFRAFGLAQDLKRPAAVRSVNVVRDPNDQRHANVSWPAADGAQFYLVRYGVQVSHGPTRWPHCFQVYERDNRFVAIHSLSKGLEYSFRVDSVNEAGVTPGFYL